MRLEKLVEDEVYQVHVVLVLKTGHLSKFILLSIGSRASRLPTRSLPLGTAKNQTRVGRILGSKLGGVDFNGLRPLGVGRRVGLGALSLPT